MIKKLSNGWLVDIQPGGRSGTRIRKTFKTQSEAKRFEAFVQGKSATGEWNPTNDKRSLIELVNLWHQLHGHTLKDGERRHSKLKQLNDDLGSPVAMNLTPVQWLAYRTKRLDKGIAKKTLNNELGYLKSVYIWAVKHGEIKFNNPLESLEPLKIDETRSEERRVGKEC